MEKIKKTKELLAIKPCGCMERDGILYPCSQCAVSRIVKGKLPEEKELIRSLRPKGAKA